jgi:hypothetical protein
MPAVCRLVTMRRGRPGSESRPSILNYYGALRAVIILPSHCKFNSSWQALLITLGGTTLRDG